MCIDATDPRAARQFRRQSGCIVAWKAFEEPREGMLYSPIFRSLRPRRIGVWLHARTAPGLKDADWGWYAFARKRDAERFMAEPFYFRTLGVARKVLLQQAMEFGYDSDGSPAVRAKKMYILPNERGS